MIRIEADTLKEAYEEAARELECSARELHVEVIQKSSPGIFGLFKKSAIIVAEIKEDSPSPKKKKVKEEPKEEKVVEKKESTKKKVLKLEPKKNKSKENKKDEDEIELGDSSSKKEEVKPKKQKEKKNKEKKHKKEKKQEVLNDTIMPESFVNDQDDDYELGDALDYTADYDDAYDDADVDMEMVAAEIKEQINELFELTCFEMNEINVSVYDESTILIELKGDDSALLIGKEGYRYKAISYMLYNWINAKYDVQLRLEIAEFLKNQEESVERYLESVIANIEKDGRAQTKILDGVLVQIALRKLREVYPDKYVVIRSTKDGQKYIIVNDYHAH